MEGNQSQITEFILVGFQLSKNMLPTPASLVGQRLKCLPAMWETWVQSLGWEDPLEKETATHSSIHAWKIPWTEEPGGVAKSRTRLSDFCVCVCCALKLSHVLTFVTPWTVGRQAPRSMGILQARILEWVAISYFRGSSQPRDRTQVSHIAGRRFNL